jgi:hypothetical protein
MRGSIEPSASSGLQGSAEQRQEKTLGPREHQVTLQAGGREVTQKAQVLAGL